MNNIAYYKEQFDKLPAVNSKLYSVRNKALADFTALGIPTLRNEEWKYTRISALFNKEYSIAQNLFSFSPDFFPKLPQHEKANVIYFINGIFSQQKSIIRSNALHICSLEQASENEYSAIVAKHFNHSSEYVKDGINALNTAMLHGGIFMHIQKSKELLLPIFIYHITDASDAPVLSQPRSLIYLAEQSEANIVETYSSHGNAESITNEVMEIIVEQGATLSFCKIQNDSSNASQVSTTHIRQTGKSVVNTITISLSGNILRNNLHAVMEAEYAEAHLYGLYFQKGKSHTDNHSIVDNVVPNCLSNELYKGIMDDESTGVFNGKIFVRKDAQKTNAFQSNKNILLSPAASINTKPQLEIFADDVKCSHGCTVGSLDEEALFYLQSRGISYQTAIALLLQGFAMEILDKIPSDSIRNYVKDLITQRLNVDL